MANQLQLSTATEYNRHSRIYAALKTIWGLSKREDPKVLVFGCSNGQECATLRDLYFPCSRIVGTDINDEALEQAKTLLAHDTRIEILRSDHEALIRHSPFDIVICSSVICLWPQTKGKDDISTIFPFSLAEESVNQLDQLMRAGSLLSMINCNYDIEDMDSVRKKYIGLDFLEGNLDQDSVEKFDNTGKPKNRTLSKHHIFLKYKQE